MTQGKETPIQYPYQYKTPNNYRLVKEYGYELVKEKRQMYDTLKTFVCQANHGCLLGLYITILFSPF